MLVSLFDQTRISEPIFFQGGTGDVYISKQHQGH